MASGSGWDLGPAQIRSFCLTQEESEQKFLLNVTAPLSASSLSDEVKINNNDPIMVILMFVWALKLSADTHSSVVDKLQGHHNLRSAGMTWSDMGGNPSNARISV